jgi:hypothetical protein
MGVNLAMNPSPFRTTVPNPVCDFLAQLIEVLYLPWTFVIPIFYWPLGAIEAEPRVQSLPVGMHMRWLVVI